MATDVVSHIEFGLASHEQVADKNLRAPSSLRYSVLAVLLPLLVVPIFFLLGRSDFFLKHGASVWVQSNDSIFAMRNRDCQVLIYGDSTAMTGIDPSLVEKDTGLRTCNIAVTNAVLSVTDNLTLDHFLAQNGKPKVLLIQLSPDSFQAANREWSKSIYPEGMLEQIRHGSLRETAQMVSRHPQETVSFAGYVAGFSAYYGMKQALYGMTHIRPDEDEVTVRNGFFTPPTPARTHCETYASNTIESGFPRKLVHSYQTNYSARTGTVLVDVAPIPACDENLKQYQHELAGVTSNQLQPLPITYFNDGRHYTASGSEVVSRMVSDEVNQAMGKSPEVLQTQHGSDTVASLIASSRTLLR